MSLDGIINDDNIILDMRETTLYGMKVFIAETVESERTAFVRTPESYVHIGRDENFAKVFMNIKYMEKIGYEHKEQRQ